MIYLTAFGREPVVYDESYFFEEYRAQYGRSYLEDFDHIATMGARRLHTIADLLGPSRRPATGRDGAPSDATEEPSDATESPRVLDLGCAYGPFLQAAKEAGYRPFGIDISESAVDYVRKHLGVAAHAGRIGTVEPAELFGVDRFHVITMWYVIEHMEDLGEVLSWISELLMPGGVFAFSTPNYDGVSRRRNRRTFLARSPRDHRSIWSPRIAAKVLPRFGMELRRVRVTGHHPERFSLGSTMPTARPLLGAWSRLAGRGDTFEAYAVTRGRTRE
jgi:2-polyprenyl-3-methyl-5-hydroxy-6-metoxy-1,4-benzoquinol methylase